MRLILFFFLLLSSSDCFNQIIIYEFCFDQPTNCAEYIMDPSKEPVLEIDTISNPDNIWQVGSPDKTVFTAAASPPNAIVTDTSNFYSINDTSSFTIECVATHPSNSVHWSTFQFSFYYNVDSDSLNDYGIIEFSPDNGNTWINLIDDTSYQNYLGWWNKPTLTGVSDGWQYAHLYMHSLGYELDIQPGTTFLWRFSFISDGAQNNQDGLMFDNILIDISPPLEVEEYQKKEKIELVKIIDLMGRETTQKSGAILIYIYSDGTREKVYITD